MEAEIVVALIVRVNNGELPAKEAVDAAVARLQSKGVVVNRIGRRHVTVSATNSQYESIFGVVPVRGESIDISIDAELGEDFSSIEYASTPKIFAN